MKVKIKKEENIETARCPVCHRQAPVKDGFYLEHESGSSICSGSGKFIQNIVPAYSTKHWNLYGDGDECGLTQSILAKFLSCPEKMRLGVVESLETDFERKEAAEFGNFFHDCLDAIYSGYMEAADKDFYEIFLKKRIYKVVEMLYEVRKAELDAMEADSGDLELHSELAKVMLPIYFEKWEEDFDAEWISLEKVYEWIYTKLRLPVRMRLKIDGVKRLKDGKIRIKDTKTKGQIIQDQIALKLPIDLQVMIYLYSYWI